MTPDFVAKSIPQIPGDKTPLLCLRRALFFLFGSYMNKRVLPVAYRSHAARKIRRQRREEYLKQHPQVKRRCLQASDGKRIDALEVWHPKAHARQKNKWIVYFPGNSEQYEDLFAFIDRYQAALPVNILVFNYRGAGDSEGPVTPWGVDLDAVAVLDYATRGLACHPRDLLVIGRSLGGGISAKALGHFPEAGFCVERSFSSLHDTVRSTVGMGVIGHVAAWLLTFCGWNLDSVKNWARIDHGRKWMVYHKTDETIPYETSQLHYALSTQEEAKKNPRLEDVEITSIWQLGHHEDGRVSVTGQLTAATYERGVHMIVDPHNQALDWDPPLWEQHLENVRRALSLP